MFFSFFKLFKFELVNFFSGTFFEIGFLKSSDSETEVDSRTLHIKKTGFLMQLWSMCLILAILLIFFSFVIIISL